ncbi:MAG TPA: Ig-like domain-containing protein [Gammaproteobacteria bacterium]|nr:Ig-like domain-containing protein [Gammaproteobacteria bacterium]
MSQSGPVRLVRPRWCASLLLAAALAASAAGAQANVIRVAAAAVGAGNNSCSLVDAINAANSNSQTGACPAGDDKTNGGDVIVLAAGTYKIGTADNDWYGPNGLPPITSRITIVGDPKGTVIMRSPNQGVSPFRIFYIGGGESLSAYNPPQDGNGKVVFTSLPSHGNLTLINLTLENGLAQGGAGGSSALGGGGGGLGAGGAIYNQGTLTLQGVTLVGNQASGGAGGSTNTTNNGDPGGGGGMGGSGDSFGEGGGFSSNPPWPDSNTPPGEFGNGGGPGQAGGVGGGGGNGKNGGFGGGGGGINGFGGFGGGGGGISPGGFGGGFGLVFDGGGAGMGGAIFNEGGSVTLQNCTLTANSSQGGAGGAAGFGQAEGLGAAIFNLNGSITISYSTLAGNTLSGSAVSGGAVYSLRLATPGSPAADASAAASLDVDSSIMYGSLQLTTDTSGNTTSSAAIDCENAGGSLSGGHDVVGPTSASCLVGSDQFTSPALLPLANNGGPTQTMAIIIGAAFNGGNTSGAPLLDQRGYVRDVAPDIGAYEFSFTQIKAPAVSGLQDATAIAGGSASQQAFNLSGNTGSQPHLGVAVTSSDSSILPAASLTLSSNCGASLALDACSLSVKPTAKGTGTVLVTLSVTNGYGQTGYGSFTQTIIPPAPVAKDDDTLTVASGQTLNAALSATEALDATLSFIIVTQPAHGKLKLSSAGSSAFTYTPNDGFIGSDKFTWKANDGSLDSNLATDSITVTLPPPPPGAPTVSNLSFNITENTAFSGTLTATGSASPSFAVGTAPSHGSVKITDASTGAFSYTPATGFTGSDSFTYTATDTVLKAKSNPATVSLSVSTTGTGGGSSGGGSSGGGSGGGSGSGGSGSGGSSGGGGANSVAPIASAMTLATYSGTPVKGTLSASDAAGNALTFTASKPAHGSVAVTAASGVFTYSPAAGYTGADSFSFTATDGVSKLVSSSAQVSVTVTAVPVSDKAAPVVGSASFTTYENVTVTGQLSASDAAGNALNYLRVTAPAHGTVTVTPASGAFSYTPATGYVGRDSFTFSASDAITTVSSTSATITLTMVALPPAAPAKPVANGAAFPAYENVVVSAAVTASEAAGDPLTYAPVTLPSHGVLNLTGGTGAFTYTPAAGYIGPDSFSFSATDTSITQTSDPATVTLSVSALPPPGPVASNLSVATYENVTVAGALPASDGGGHAFTYAVAVGPAHGILSLNAATGAFTYAPTASYIGADSFTFTVTDNTTLAISAPATVTLSVDPVPGSDPSTAAPLAGNASVTVYESQVLSARVSAASAGGNALTYTAVSQPTHGILNLTTNSGLYTYTPTPTYTGADSFSFTATDNGTGVVSANATVSITVATAPPPATPPQVSDAAFTLYQDQPLSGTLAAADAAGNPVEFSVVQPDHGTVSLTAATGAFTYTPPAGFTGSDSFTFTAIDTSSNAASSAATVTLDVSATPITGVAPLASGASVSVYQGQVLKGLLAAVTVGGDTLSYALKSKPAHGSVKVTAASGVYSYSPTAGYTGKDSFSFVATDKVTHLMSSAATLAVTVVSPPLQAVAPLANGLALSVYSGQPIDSAVSAVDVNGNPVTYAVTTKPKNGSLTLQAGDGGFSYTPAAGFTGSDSFAYTATDTVSKLVSTAAAVEITVVPAPPAPVHHGGPSLVGKGSYGSFILMLLALLSLGRRLYTARRCWAMLAVFAATALPATVLSDDAPAPVVEAPVTDAWYVGGDANLIKPDSKRDASGGGLKGWGLLVGRDLGDFALEFDAQYHADAPQALGDLANWKTYGADGLWYFQEHKSDVFSPFLDAGLGLADQYRGDDSKVRSAYLKFGAGINSAPWRSLPLRFRADLAVQHVFSGYNDLLLSLGVEFTFGGSVPPPVPPTMPDASPLEQYPMAWCTAQGGTPYETSTGWVCEEPAKPAKPVCPPAASSAAAPAAASAAAPAASSCPPQDAPPPR